MIKLIFSITLLLVFYNFNLNASFEPIGIGPRAVALSNAYTAICDDAYSTCYNPSGLSRLKRAEVATYYGSLYSGLTDGSNLSQLFIGYAQPLEKYGNFGISYYSFTLADWYSESIITFSYARELPVQLLKNLLPEERLDLGLSMKILGKTYSDPEGYTTNAYDSYGNATFKPDEVFSNGYSKSGYTIDLGLQYSPIYGYNIGFAILNFIEPNLGLKYADNVSNEIKLGVSRASKDLILTIDLSTKRFIDTEYKLNFGAEKYFRGGFGIRGGLSIGPRRNTSLSAGLTYKIENLQFDYGFFLPLSGISSFGSHRVGLTFRFGKVYSEERVLLEKEIEARQRAEEEAKKARLEVDRILRTQKELEKALKESEQAKVIEKEKKGIVQPTEKTSLMEEYIKAVNYYNRRVSEGINLLERMDLLTKIINRFKNKSIDLSIIEKEYKDINKQYNENKKNYEISMDYYRRIISKTASPSEKIELLESILKKYEKTGLDMSEVKSELNKLKENK